MEKGKATRKVKEDLKEIRRGYLPTDCFIVEAGQERKVECREIPPLLIEGKARKTVKVCNRRNGKCVTVKEGEEVAVLEFKGAEVYITKDEGDYVKKWEKVGYTISGKGEGKTFKTYVQGEIVLIEEVLGEKEDHYRVYVRRR